MSLRYASAAATARRRLPFLPVLLRIPQPGVHGVTKGST